ncbi:MAG TPA: hypothetical protein VF290_02460 [Pyrinomonadaceae bacterium]
MVTISNQATSRARVNALRKRLADFRSAKTGLRCSPRIDFHKHASSFFRFVREHKHEVRPSSIPNRLRQYAIGESLNVQIFYGYQPVLVNDLSRFLVVKIAPLVPDVIVEARKQKHRFTSAVRSPLSTRNAPLQAPQFVLCRMKPSRIGNHISGAERSERSYSDINPNHFRAEGKGFRVTLDAEQHEPSSGFSFNCHRLNRTNYWPMELDVEPPKVRQPDLGRRESVSYLSEGETIIAPHGSETGIAWFLTVLYPAEERAECQVNAPEGTPQGGRGHGAYVFAHLPNLSQLQSLINVRDRLLLALPRFASFLQGCVVDLTANSKLIVEKFFLSLCRVEAIAESFDHELILPRRFSLAY